jgi:hypothetical protein
VVKCKVARKNKSEREAIRGEVISPITFFPSFNEKKKGKLHFTPLKYPPIFTFASKV